MTLTDLATLMGVSQKDTGALVACLRVWINRGLTLEESIDRHMSVMRGLVARSDQIPKELVVETFFPTGDQ